eukprot:11325469-Ditylum_brightwellii.AAC.1
MGKGHKMRALSSGEEKGQYGKEIDLSVFMLTLPHNHHHHHEKGNSNKHTHKNLITVPKFSTPHLTRDRYVEFIA